VIGRGCGSNPTSDGASSPTRAGDIGRDTATSVTEDLDAEHSTFGGRISWIQIDVGEDAEDADHYITPEERFRIAMAIQ
jgi:hypothetical protein